MIKFFTKTLLPSSFFVSSFALAGPTVTVNFKNQMNTNATYTVITNNESLTYLNASPKPEKIVKPKTNNVYHVTSHLSPSVNFAIVRYKSGVKECIFTTTYVQVLPTMPPKWNKSVEQSGGAQCTANIVSTNLVTHEWAVDFVMK